MVARLGMPPMALSPGFHVVNRSAGMTPVVCVVAPAGCDTAVFCARGRLPLAEFSPAKPLVFAIMLVTTKSPAERTHGVASTKSNLRKTPAIDCTGALLVVAAVLLLECI